MLWKLYTYKWYSLEQLFDSTKYDNYHDNRYLLNTDILRLTDKKDGVKVTQTEIGKSNWHGSYAWPSFLWPRLITFTGTIFSPKNAVWEPQIAKLERKIDELRKNIAVQWNPMSNPYFDLSRWTRYNEQRTCKAKVYSTIDIKHNWLEPTAEFSFDLYCPDPNYYHPTLRTATGSKGTVWGTNLDNYLPNPSITSYTGAISVNNQGNFMWPCKINVAGTGQNVIIYNLTNGYKTKVTWTTYNLTVDTTDTSTIDKQIQVLEWSNDIRNRIVYGLGIYLDPWINNIVVLSDDPSNLTVTIQRRDTYS